MHAMNASWISRSMSSPLPGRDLELLADRTPHLLGRLTGLEGLVDRPAAEGLHDVVVRDRPGVPLPEVVAHPYPELRQSHGEQGRWIG